METRIKGMRWAFFLATVVILIYAYTMYAMKQETILEEIDQELARERGEIILNK